jgi:phage shock protein E
MSMKKIALAALCLLIAIVYALVAVFSAHYIPKTNPKSLVAIIDVRDENNYIYSHLEGASGISHMNKEFKSLVMGIDKHARIGVYGANWDDADRVIQKMRGWGFDKLQNLGSLQQATDATGLGQTF